MPSKKVEPQAKAKINELAEFCILEQKIGPPNLIYSYLNIHDLGQLAQINKKSAVTVKQAIAPFKERVLACRDLIRSGYPRSMLNEIDPLLLMSAPDSYIDLHSFCFEEIGLWGPSMISNHINFVTENHFKTAQSPVIKGFDPWFCPFISISYTIDNVPVITTLHQFYDRERPRWAIYGYLPDGIKGRFFDEEQLQTNSDSLKLLRFINKSINNNSENHKKPSLNHV